MCYHMELIFVAPSHCIKSVLLGTSDVNRTTFPASSHNKILKVSNLLFMTSNVSLEPVHMFVQKYDNCEVL